MEEIFLEGKDLQCFLAYFYLVSIFGGTWKNSWFQVNICMQFPESIRMLDIVCIWVMKFEIS